MKATLEAEVEVWDIAVFAELAMWESRPDLQLLCRAARDEGGLDEALVDQVLPGLSPRGCRNLIRHLGYLRLVDRQGGLTALGRRCAEAGDAPAWEQGAYHLLVAVHPLFGRYVLDFKRAKNDPRDRDFDLDGLPGWLSPSRDQVFASAFDHGIRFSIADFPAARGQDPVCRGWEMPPGKLRWEIDLLTGRNHWTIEGEVGSGQATPFRTPSESADPAELVGLYAQWESQWDARAGRVLIPYDGRVGQGGRENFLRSWRYKSVKVGRFGTFNDVVVRDVPVGPKTGADASTWATAMLVARAEAAGAYVTRDGWKEEWADAIAGTPLYGRAGDAPEPDQVEDVNGHALAPRTAWLLSAAVDVGMGA